jgi:hypothetical protein
MVLEINIIYANTANINININVINVSKVRTVSIIRLIALMMDAVQTSKTLVNSHQYTWRYNPEDSHLRHA